MVGDLAKSGLVPEDVGAFPFPIQGASDIRGADAVYVIPYYDIKGDIMVDKNTGIAFKMHRKRINYPDTLKRDDVKKKYPKYKGASTEQVGSLLATAPYIPPGWWSNKDEVGYICEGEKKVAALTKRFGVPAIAIPGCYSWSYTTTEGDRGLHPWIAEAVRLRKRVVVIPDGDIRRPHISRAYKGLATALNMPVEMINFSLLAPDKLDDWLVANPKATFSDVKAWERVDINHMRENALDLQAAHHLEMQGQNGLTIIANENNFVRLLEGHPVFAEQIRYNLDKHRVEYAGTPENYDVDAETLVHFQGVFGIHTAKIGIIRNALSIVAQRQSYSPRVNYLDGLVWDDEVRLDQWMVDYLGAKDDEYTREIGRKALVAAVARTYRPGCPVDYMTILKGPQGIGKSGCIKILFGPDDTLEYIRDVAEGKDALQQNSNIWCHSDEELGNLSRSDKNKLKAQITIRVDRFRAPYDRNEKVHPRRYVMWGSTNDDNFLPDDSSGQRRYAVVEMGGPVDFEGLEAVRDQLWAEAVAIYKRGGLDYSNIEGASAASEKYVLKSLLGELVETRLEGHFRDGSGKGCVKEFRGAPHYYLKLLTVAALIDEPRIYGARLNELVSVLKKMGWELVASMRIDGKVHTKVWTKRVTPV
jgi:hypothetical protein